MKILIVEDDSFKFSRIESLANDLLKTAAITNFDNVHDTINYLQDNTPDKIILDMSLPSHAARIGEGSPLSMPTGGIEIILELRSLNKNNIPLIILTQYPEIEIENEYYTIDESKEEIETLYGIKNILVVLYENDSVEWQKVTSKFLRG